MESCEKEVSADRDHAIAVESREAERMSSLVGDATALT